jgi:hypothetical protein
VNAPAAREPAKADTIYRVLYSPDEAEEVTTTTQVSDVQDAPRTVGASKKRKSVRREEMVIPAFGDLEVKRKERARRAKKGMKDQRWATIDSTTIWHVIGERCEAAAAEQLLLPLPRPHIPQPPPARGWAPAARPGELPPELVDTGNPTWWDAVSPPSDSERERWRRLSRADESPTTEPTDASLAEAHGKDRWHQLASLTLDTPIKANITVAQYWYLWVEYGVEPDQLSEDSKMLQFLRSDEFKQIEGTLDGDRSSTGRAESQAMSIRAIHNRWEATRPRYWVPTAVSEATERRNPEWRDLPIGQPQGQDPQTLFEQDQIEPGWFSARMSAVGDVPTDAMDVLKVGHPQWWTQQHPRLKWLPEIWADARVRLTLSPARERRGNTTVPPSVLPKEASRQWTCP